MLKKRLIATLVVKDGWVVQSIGFSKFLPVGTLATSVEYLNKWGIDEILVLDIDASVKNIKPDSKMIESVSKFSQTPIAVGGGISSIEDMKELIRNGADKVIINSQFLKDPDIVQLGASYFGNQCIVVSIDINQDDEGNYYVFSKNIDCKQMDYKELITIAQEYGAGEIFINAVHKDGMKTGYDIELYNEIKNLINIPVIFCGGVGHIDHLIEGSSIGIDALAVGNYFHFTEMSVILSKEVMSRADLTVRTDTFASYKTANYDPEESRITKLNDLDLQNMRFVKIEDEVI
ncbi:HisA/HisF-related TIM barrel protein [Gammaproteobacteria bacterium]|nr:HisA/HisF-related TIM barrel protein [Gammaproteobacteria bacterium]